MANVQNWARAGLARAARNGSLPRRKRIDSLVDPPTIVASDKWLGSYRLCLALASGGMATVYLARANGSNLKRFVAVKKLARHLAEDPVFTAMFMDEAHIASRINHPNVCSVYDCAVDNGVCYMVMEYLAGEPLSHVRRALARSRALRATSTPYVARIVADACEGLHAAHELTDATGRPLEVVHRDVSLENLFVTYDGVVKVVDFGVASAADQAHHTRTGIVKGRFAYIDPVVLNGRKPDRRADVWGLGVVYWELLTGRRLFQRATDAETLRAVLDHRVPKPSAVRPGIPPELDEIALCALSPEPDARYPTTRAMGQDLSRFLARHQRSVGLAEVADLMDRLFPGGRGRKRELLEIASRLDDGDDVRDLRDGNVVETTPAGQAVPEQPLRPRWRSRVGRDARGALVGLVAGVVGSIGITNYVPGVLGASAAATRVAPRAAALHAAAPPAKNAVTGNTAVPIQLGPGAHTLEIVPAEDGKSRNVVVRVLGDNPAKTATPEHATTTHTHATATRRRAPAAKSNLSAKPEPLQTNDPPVRSSDLP